MIGGWLGSGNSVMSARLEGSSVTPATTIASYASGAVATLRLAVNAAGKAVATWTHRTSTNYEIMASRYTPGGGWTRPTVVVADALDTLTGGAPNQEVGIDACGAVQLVHEDREYRVHRRRYNPGSGWAPRVQLAKPGLFVRMSTAANGITTVVWDNDQNEVLGARYE